MSIRLRLALFYAALTSAVVVVIVFTAYILHDRDSYDDVDQSLVDAAEHFRADLSSTHPLLGIEGLLSRTSGEANVRVRSYRPDGEVLNMSPPGQGSPPLDPGEVMERNEGPVYGSFLRWLPGGRSFSRSGAFATATDENGARTRLYSLEVAAPGGGRGYVLSWTSLESLDRSMQTFRITMLALGVGSVAVVSLGSLLLAGRALRPIASLTRTARAIAKAGTFSRRLPEHRSRDELWHLACTFNEMLASLEESYRNQQRFVADASHELRAPLTIIEGNAELLAKIQDMPPEERAEAVSHIQREARRMSRMVIELLTLARADTGKGIERRPLELDVVLLDAVSTALSASPDAVIVVQSIAQVCMDGDADKLRQLIVILLDNAIKYSPPGWTIRVSLTQSGDEGVLRIADKGIGIPAYHLPHIFDRFYRVDPARSREVGGTGLGLSIAKWIVDQHGGEVSIESTVGRGTTVTVRLPLVRQPQPEATAAVQQHPVGSS